MDTMQTNKYLMGEASCKEKNIRPRLYQLPPRKVQILNEDKHIGSIAPGFPSEHFIGSEIYQKWENPKIRLQRAAMGSKNNLSHQSKSVSFL